MTPQDAKQLVQLVAKDRELAAQLWKAIVDDRKNVDALIEALHEAVRMGARLPT